MITCTVSLAWLNGEDTFCIGQLGHRLLLEEKCGGVGIFEIYWRLMNERARTNDVRETIRIGLIGGGMREDHALAAVKSCVDLQPLAQHVFIAQAILAAALIGVKDDPVGKTEPGAVQMDPASTTPTDGSGAASSMAAAPPSALIPEPLTP